MVEFTLWDIVRQLALSLRWTVALSLIALAGGTLVGGTMLVARLARWPGAQRGVALYVQVFQGTPLLMQMFLAYFGLALLGIDTSPLAAAAVCLTLYAGAYLAEIWRGCVEAVPRGQWEASSALALSFGEQLRHVVLPQALRLATAPTVGFVVQLIRPCLPMSTLSFPFHCIQKSYVSVATIKVR